MEERKIASSDVIDDLRQGLEITDDAFDSLYPASVQSLSARQWTPVIVAKLAAAYLVNDVKGTKVLDIGSGCGKFCLIGAATTKGNFYGVEQRENLVDLSKKIAFKNQLPTAAFIHTNIAAISFAEYNAFYFFNPFFENISSSSIIDNKVLRSKALFFQYSKYVHDQLCEMPIGTRVATYWSICNEVPESYDIESVAFNGKLVFWKKIE